MFHLPARQKATEGHREQTFCTADIILINSPILYIIFFCTIFVLFSPLFYLHLHLHMLHIFTFTYMLHIEYHQSKTASNIITVQLHVQQGFQGEILFLLQRKSEKRNILEEKVVKKGKVVNNENFLSIWTFPPSLTDTPQPCAIHTWWKRHSSANLESSVFRVGRLCIPCWGDVCLCNMYEDGSFRVS